jgi:hypothetical protein
MVSVQTFYQPLFSNSSLAIHFPSAISLQQFPFTQKPPIKTPTHQKASLHPKASHPPSASLSYPVVNEEVEQQLLGRGMTL